MALWLAILLLPLSLDLSIQDPEPEKPAPAAVEEKESHIADPNSLLGKPAPSVVLSDFEGKSFDLSELSDEVVVLEWTHPSCRFSRRLNSQHRVTPMIRRWTKEQVKWVSIDSTFFAHPEKIRPWVEKNSIKHPCLIDLEGLHAEAFGIRVTPTYVVVNRGQIVYHGALDDDVWGRKLERSLYLDDAIRHAVAEKEVASPLTRAYGMQLRTRRVEDERRAQIDKARQKQNQEAGEKGADSQQSPSSEN
ncbi:MAG: redoxin domain-containing protein [Planctomycetota bacterium]|nr:redoxin domain-containing protein [Planctomycetota bacterium]